MRSLRFLLPLAATLAAVPLAAPTTAGAVTTKAYTVSFEGSVQIDWSEPRWKVSENCYDTVWNEGSGSQTWNVRSRGATKVLLHTNGRYLQATYGTWTLNEDTDSSGLPAKGEITRTGGYSTIYTAGTCGTGPQYPNQGPTGDCGTRLLNFEVELHAYKGELTPDVTLHGNGREKTGFETCTIVVPENVVALSWPAVSTALPEAKLLGATKAFTVKGHDQLTGKGGVWDASSKVTIDWTATFTPAGQPARPKKPGKKRKKARRHR